MKTNQTKPPGSSMFKVRRPMFGVLPSSTLHLPSLAVPKRSGGGFLLRAFCFLPFLTPASAATRYVWQGSPSPAPPYTSWANAATNIQDAVDAADPGDTVLVAGGVYATGGRAVGTNQLVNRVAIDRAITVESLMGPEVTIIDGQAALLCVYLTNSATVSGFTLTNGVGGVWCETTVGVCPDLNGDIVSANSEESGEAAGEGGGEALGTVTNCVLIGNGSAAYRANLNNCTITLNGPGAISSTLNNCSVIANHGGGVCSSSANNCRIMDNSGVYGGGAFESTLVNCTAIDNWSPVVGGGVYESTVVNSIIVGYGHDYGGYSTVSYSCTTYLQPGPGNIFPSWLFVDQAGGNYRLLSNSSCIDAGNNAAIATSTDLDGRSRIIGGTVDMGAYEFQGPSMSEFIGWLEHYGLATDGSADTLDADLDGHNAWQEWKAWTDPTNALSVLRLLPPQPQTNGTLVLWQSVLGQSYSVERATNASGPFSLLRGYILGKTGITSVTDTNPADANPILYRVGVGN